MRLLVFRQLKNQQEMLQKMPHVYLRKFLAVLVSRLLIYNKDQFLENLIYVLNSFPNLPKLYEQSQFENRMIFVKVNILLIILNQLRQTLKKMQRSNQLPLRLFLISTRKTKNHLTKIRHWGKISDLKSKKWTKN